MRTSPIQLSEADIAKYQELVFQHTGKRISHEEAISEAQSLLLLVQMVYRPITKEEFNKHHKPVEQNVTPNNQ